MRNIFFSKWTLYCLSHHKNRSYQGFLYKFSKVIYILHRFHSLKYNQQGKHQCNRQNKDLLESLFYFKSTKYINVRNQHILNMDPYIVHMY